MISGSRVGPSVWLRATASGFIGADQTIVVVMRRRVPPVCLLSELPARTRASGTWLSICE